MARRRYVSTDISVDKRIAQLSAQAGDFAVLLYTWMIPHATDDGGITADPEELRLMVVPGMKKKAAAISIAIDAMLQLGLIEGEGGRLYFPPDTFYKYQNYIHADRRRTPQNPEIPREMPQNPASPSPSHSVTHSHSPLVVVGVNAPDEISAVLSEFAQYGKTGPLTVSHVEEAVEHYGLDWTRRAVKVCGKSGAGVDHPPWSYVEKTLKRWKEDGEPDDDKPDRRKQAKGTHTNGMAGGVPGLDEQLAAQLERRQRRTV